ncbi:BapA prefix-like domain-containing protein, partial [Acinetobacter bereziniae]|uniref:BapA/Bap/LapF family prefix-like domain-containing protein n=1 Tax=Acinetobacter bereziniae TaxID=106648 RepID=UPI002FDA1BAA
MPKVTIIAKEGHNIILQQANLNVVRLTENSVVLVKVQKEDVVSLIRIGNALVVTLKNGETITIENYFNDKNNSDNSIVFEDNDGKLFVPEFGSDGLIVNYNPIESIEPLLYHEGTLPILPWLAIGAGAGVVAAIASADTNHGDGRDRTPPTKAVINPVEAGKKDPITGTA